MKFEQFEQIATACNGRAKDFKQSMYLKRFGSPAEVQNGLCRALSVAYVVKNYSKTIGNQPDTDSDFVVPDMTRDLQTKKFFEAFSFARIKLPVLPAHMSPEEKHAHGNRFMWIAKTQYSTRRQQEATTVLQANDMEVKSMVDAMSLIGGNMMQHKGQFRFSVPEEKASSANFPDGQGFWIINVGAHATAVCFRSKEGATKAKLFDPNNGQATFQSYDDCRNFMNTFLRKEYGTESFFVHAFG